MLPRIRLSLRSTMGAILAIAVVFASLRSPGPLTASLLYTLTICVMLTGIVGAVASIRRRRFGWFGLVIFCGTYLLIAFGPYPWLNNAGLRPPPFPTLKFRDSLPIGWVSIRFWDSSTPSILNSHSTALPAAASMSIGPNGLVIWAREAPGEQVLHCLGALVFASLGYAIGAAFSEKRPLPL